MDKDLIMDVDFPLWDEESEESVDETIEDKNNESITKEPLTDKDFLNLIDDDDDRIEENKDKKSDKDSDNKDTKDEELSDDSDKENEDENESEDTSSESDDESEEEPNLLNLLVKDLKDNGILNNEFEVSEDEELTGDKLLEFVDAEVNKRVEDEFSNFASDLDEEAKSFINFKRNGGSTVDFLKLYIKDTELPVTDVESPEHQEEFLRYYLKEEEEMDYDEIEEELELYKERNQLEKKANKAFSKVNSRIEQEKKEALEKQNELKKLDEEGKKKFVGSLVDTIKSKDSIQDFTINSDDKKTLIDFIVKPSVKLGDRKVPEIQAKINDIYKDPEKLLLFAKLVKNDFDISDIVKKVETKVTKKALDTVASKRKGTPKTVTQKGKYLADIFK